MNWGIRYSEDFAHKHKAINKLKALLNKKRNKPRMTYPKIGDNVWDSKQNKWVIEDKQGKGTNILEYKKDEVDEDIEEKEKQEAIKK